MTEHLQGAASVTDKQRLLDALTTLFPNGTETLTITFFEDGAALMCTATVPETGHLGARLYLHRDTDTIFRVPTYVPNFTRMAAIAADPAARGRLERA